MRSSVVHAGLFFGNYSPSDTDSSRVFFTLLVLTSFRGTAVSSTRKLLQRGGGCVVVCAVVLVVQSNLLWRIRIMCVNVF